MKKYIIVILLLTLSLLPASSAAYAKSRFKTLESSLESSEAYSLQSVLKSEKYTIPINAIINSLDAEVEWNDTLKTLFIKKEDMEIFIELNTGLIKVNGVEANLEDLISSYDDREAVPVSLISDILDKTIVFDHGTDESDASYITGSIASTPENVMLGSDSAVDWVHCGLGDSSGFTRKDGVIPQISNFLKIGTGNISWFSGIPVFYSWVDGTPTEAITGTSTSIYVTGIGNGFEITVPADANARTFKLYVGAWGAKGKLTVSLGDGNTDNYEAYVDSMGDIDCKVVTIDFKAASDNQTLSVKYVVDNMYDSGFGNINLQAAELFINQ